MKAYDIFVNHIGMFIMANIPDGLKDNDDTNTYSTQNSKENFALMFLDHSGTIQEIESYDTADAANNLGAPYPQKLVVTRKNKQSLRFSFISTRDNGADNQGGGVYITQFANPQAVFVTGNSLAI